jgi:hypothetical protein
MFLRRGVNGLRQDVFIGQRGWLIGIRRQEIRKHAQYGEDGNDCKTHEHDDGD